MKILDLVQGSQEWHEHRANHFNASDAPAMMGMSKYTPRVDLMRRMATGEELEVTPQLQHIFDKGHAAEAAARPLVEKLIDAELYPVTGVDDSGVYSASFDGITLDEKIVFEHKLWSADLAKQVEAKDLHPNYYWQLEQQLLVSGAEKAIFVVSDGTIDNFRHMEYTPVPGRAEQLIAGWDQFKADLDNFKHAAPTIEPIGKAPDALPALRIEVQGMVTASNLAEFKDSALAVFGAINKDLQTDDDFANAAKTVKWCGEVETKLEAAKAHALSQTASIDELFNTIDAIKDEARTVRLDLDKLVKARKIAVRGEILTEAQEAFSEHIEKINMAMGGKITLPSVPVDFAGAMKGKKTVDSLRSAVADELARAKIAANQLADSIRINLETLRADSVGYEGLFADAQQLVLKENDDLKNLIKARIDQQKLADEEKIKAEAEKQRQAEAAKESEAISADPVSTQAPEQSTPREAVRASIIASVPTGHSQLYSDTPAEPLKNMYRPDDKEIISALAVYFGQDDKTILRWLRELIERA